MKVRKIMQIGRSKAITLPFPFFSKYRYCTVDIVDETEDTITLKFRGVGNAQNGRNHKERGQNP